MTTPTDAQIVERLSELERRATKGPWRVELPSEENTYSDTVLGGPDGCDEVLDKGCHGCIADLAFAADCRNSLPRLLELAREAIQSRTLLAAAQAAQDAAFTALQSKLDSLSIEVCTDADQFSEGVRHACAETGHELLRSFKRGAFAVDRAAIAAEKGAG